MWIPVVLILGTSTAPLEPGAALRALESLQPGQLVVLACSRFWLSLAATVLFSVLHGLSRQTDYAGWLNLPFLVWGLEASQIHFPMIVHHVIFLWQDFFIAMAALAIISLMATAVAATAKRPTGLSPITLLVVLAVVVDRALLLLFTSPASIPT